jgi:hypothetical protein
MSRTFKFALPTVLYCLCLALSSPAADQPPRAAGPATTPPTPTTPASVGEPAHVESWNYHPERDYEPNPRAIIQQKAMERSQQRTWRLASLSWYGMSNSRPTASTTPFMSMYSPAWQTPGGRPFAWNPGSPQLWNSYVR